MKLNENVIVSKIWLFYSPAHAHSGDRACPSEWGRRVPLVPSTSPGLLCPIAFEAIALDRADCYTARSPGVINRRMTPYSSTGLTVTSPTAPFIPLPPTH